MLSSRKSWEFYYTFLLRLYKKLEVRDKKLRVKYKYSKSGVNENSDTKNTILGHFTLIIIKKVISCPKEYM